MPFFSAITQYYTINYIISKQLLQAFTDCNWCQRLTYKGSNACSIMSLAVDVKKRCGQATG